jgi:tetratricopeptide (TPR) repeat protein
MRIQALLLARDESHNLADCVHSLHNTVDAVAVFDTGSRDHTAEVTRELGAAWEPLRWNDDFAAARNEALERLDADWVLVIDADERLDVGAPQRIRGAVAEARESDVVFYLEQRTYTDDVEALGYTGLSGTEALRRGATGFVPQPQPRLFRLGRGLHYRGRVCEQLVPDSGAPFPLLAPTLGALHHFGEMEGLARREERATQRLRLALQAGLSGEEPGAWGRLGALLNRRRMWQAALPYLRAAEETTGPSPALDLQIGVARLHLGLTEGAIASLQRAWDELPEHPELSGWLARALLRSGRAAALAEAEDLLERAIEQAPELDHVVVQRAVLHRRLDEFEESRALLQTILERNPVHMLALKELGAVALLQGRLNEAEDNLRQAARLRPDDAEVWNNLGCALERRAIWREALSVFDRAVQLDSGNEAYLRNRCVAHAACSRWTAMCSDAQQALLACENPIAMLVRLRETCLDAGWLRALRKLESWAVGEGWLRSDECIVSTHDPVESPL